MPLVVVSSFSSSSTTSWFLCFIETYFVRVFAAFFADRDRAAAERFFAALRPWRESARFEAALLPSRFRAREVARERFADFFVPFFLPFWTSRAACLRVFFDPFLGGGKSTPARRAFDRPMAIASDSPGNTETDRIVVRS